MSSLGHVKIEEFIGKDGTSHRGYTRHLVDQSKLVHGFRDEAMRHTVQTAGTVGEGGLGERLRSCRDNFHYFLP